MHNIELLVFDMAGTVVNEENVVYKTLQKAINKYGYELGLNFVLEHGAGKEKHQAIKDILLQADYDEIEERSAVIFEVFKKFLKEAYDSLNVTSFEGVEDLLSLIWDTDIKIALNTGYNEVTAKKLLCKMNWKKGTHYDALVTADDTKNGRPHPDMILIAMEKLGVADPSKVLKAGDSIIDIEEGKNAKCGLTVGVTTGAHSRKQLESANPDYVLDSLFELTRIIKFK
ncbi:HAD hydrolase-like protein [Maribacter antarcticus]|uniref:HAD hydrolase-like protein n=1 Tax=Maribacter antarcticus TaxID=505250 RepID=UPI00047EDE9D|nr:HAD hydrolase-like protein [Maribacter antarcticus]